MIRTFVGLAALLSTIAAGPSLAQEMSFVDLGWDIALNIAHDPGARTVRLVVSTLEHALMIVELHNASFAPETLQKVRFCADCPEVYFLSVDNLLAEGDTTGLMVYESVPGGWTVTILPIERPLVSDTDGDGSFELISNPWRGEPKRYEFRAGLIAEAS